MHLCRICGYIFDQNVLLRNDLKIFPKFLSAIIARTASRPEGTDTSQKLGKTATAATAGRTLLIGLLVIGRDRTT